MTKKILLCDYHEESNSFNPVITDTEHFYHRDISACRSFSELVDPNSVIGGASSVLAGKDYTYCASVYMRAKSGGPVSDRSISYFLEKTLDAIRREKPDGVLVSLHGATVSETKDDVCGDILKAVREAAGEKAVIGAAFDLHANITEAIRLAADYVCGYQTYPHVDFANTGKRAARIMDELLGGRRLKAVYASVPMIAPPQLYTTNDPELRALMDRAASFVESGIAADYTIFQVQPWLDIPEIASTVTLIGEDEKQLIEKADELAEMEFELRKILQGDPSLSIDDVIRIALENTSGKPVILGDGADSPNAGATGDFPDTIRALLPYRDRLRAAVSITDPAAVAKAFDAGVGATIDISLGGAVAPGLAKPLTVTDAVVKSLHLGTFLMGYPLRHAAANIGRTVVLQAGKILILVAENASGHGNLQFYRGFGIDPELMDLVCVKACTSFKAPYQAIAEAIYTPNTPGVAGADLKSLPFHRIPKPLYPFDEITKADIQSAKRYR